MLPPWATTITTSRSAVAGLQRATFTGRNRKAQRFRGGRNIGEAQPVDRQPAVPETSRRATEVGPGGGEGEVAVAG